MEDSKTEVEPLYGPALFLNSARSGENATLEQCVRIGNVDVNTANANGLTALHLASKEGHVDTIVELLKLGADYSAASKKGNTPLHTAALAGKADVVRVLIQAGSNVNAQSQHGFTPLYMAAQENHANVVKLLLSYNARQDLATEDGYTPLAVAVQQGHENVVSLLVGNVGTPGGSTGRAKSKTNVITPTGTMSSLRDRTSQRPPPLHIAARKDDVQAAETILRNVTNNSQSSEKWAILHDSTKSGFTALHVASRYGNQRIAGLLIEHGSDVNFTAKNAVTPLHVASKWGHQNMARLLLNMGARIEAKTGDDLTALHCAARSGHDTAVVILLERGALVSARSRSGLTPLHMSAQGDHTECASILLNRGANIDDITVDKLTPLHIVSHYGHLKTAKMLVESNCNINALAPNGFTPLHIACKKNHLKVVELLLRHGAPIEAPTESGLTPLHVASFMGNENLVGFLLQRGANPNSVTHRGETPLHFASRARRLPIMTQLLDNGAQPDAKSKDLNTALHLSARQGDTAAVKLLLQRGASPNCVTADLNTPMHGAAREGHSEVVDVLVNNGANMTALNKRGFSPLHMAAKFGKLRVAKLLLDRGVNPNLEGKYSLTPLHVATHYGTSEVAMHLLERQAKPQCAAKNGYTPLHIASKRNRREIAGALLRHGANPNAESVNGYSPLHLAASGGLAEIASMLLDDDAQPNCRSKNGLAPMHLCAQEDKVNVAEILEKNGAEIDPQTKAGYTPLHTACHFGQINMIQFLLRHGASVKSTTKMGYTPLHQAAQQGQVIVIKILLKHKADPNALTAAGQTALSIAESLGIDPVVDILKNITDVIVSPAVKKRKLNMALPELMQEAPMSDWEDETQSPLTTITEEMEPTDSSILRSAAGNFKNKSREVSPPRDLQVTRDPSQRWTWSEDAFEKGLPNGKDEFGSSTASLGPSQIMRELQYMRSDSTYPSDDVMCESPKTPKTWRAEHQARMNETGFYSWGGRTNHYFMITDEEFFVPQSIQLQACAPRMRPLVAATTQPSEDDSSRPTLGAIIGKNGGIVNHPQKVRVIIPPGALSGPTKITCRLVSRDRLSHPPPLKNAEALASRVVEMGPPGLKFLKPVIVEVPHFASLRGGEREISVRRSDGGRLWKATVPPKDAQNELDRRKAVQEVIKAIDTEPSSKDEIRWDRVTHIHTSDLPQYFALVSRVHQQTQTFGPQGGTVQSSINPNVSVIIPPGSLSKNTPVNIEVQPVSREIMTDLLGSGAPAVSPLVSVEPQDGAFTKPVTVSVPCPSDELKPSGKQPTKLRLIAGTTEMGDGPICWKDVTDAVPMSPTSTGVTFTPDLAAIRFMVLACPPGCMPNQPDSEQLAKAVFREASTAPFLAKFIIFAKRTSLTEGQLKIFLVVIDDDDVAKLVDEEGFEEVARSGDVEVLEGKPQFIELSGNLRSFVKSDQEAIGLTFEPFKKNSLPLNVQIMNIREDPTCLVSFTRSPRDESQQDTQQKPTCSLNASLPEILGSLRSTRQQNPAGDDDYLLPDSSQPSKVEWPCSDEDPADNALPVGVAYAKKVLSKQPSPVPDAVEEFFCEPVYAAPAASAPKQPRRVKRELESRSEKNEDQSVLDDGSTVKRQVVTTTYFRTVVEWPADSGGTYGQMSTPTEYEETVGVEVNENLVKLPPGIVEPFGKNADVDVWTETFDDVFADGVPVQRTVRTINVKLRPATELRNGLDATDKTIRVPQSLQRPKSPIARMDDLLKSAADGVPSAQSYNTVLARQSSTNGTIESGKITRLGDTESRSDVKETEHSLPDGSIVKHKTNTTRYTAPLFQITSVGNKEVEKLIGEQLLKTNIEEIITRLPPGVVFPFGTSIETEAVEESFQEISPDGSPVNKKLVNVTVRKVSPNANSGWDTVRSLDSIGAETIPNVLRPSPGEAIAERKRSSASLESGFSANDPDGRVNDRDNTIPVTVLKEFRRGCRDGSAIVHRVKTTHHVEPVTDTPAATPSAHQGEVVKGRSVAVDVEETIFKLPTGAIEPDGRNVLCEIKAENFREQTSQETPVQRKVTVVDVQLKPADCELQSKVYFTEEKTDVADGTVVIKKIRTTEYFKDVREFIFNGVQDIVQTHQEPVKFDVVENVLELQPGCVEPFGLNVFTAVTVDKVNETRPNGLPVKKKTVKLVVSMKDKSIKQPGKDNRKFAQPKSEIDKAVNKSTPNRSSGTETVEEPVQVKTKVEDDKPRVLDNGVILKHRTVTDIFFKPIKEVAIVNGRPQILSAREEVVGKEIEESFIELPQGVEDQFGKNLESVTNTYNLAETVLDGVPVIKRVSRTKVNRTKPSGPSDDEIMKHIKDATLKDIIPEMEAERREMLNPTGAVKKKTNETKPDNVEYHRCLDDGTVVRYIATATQSPALNIKVAPTLPQTRTSMGERKPPVETEIDENIIALPLGLINPLAENCDASVIVKTSEEPLEDGTNAKVSVAAAIIAPKRRTVTGGVKSRVKLSEDKTNLDGGVSVLKKIKIVEFFRPIKEVVTSNGIETEIEVREIPVKYDITENIVELHPGCVEPFGRNVSTDVTVNKVDDHSVNGYPATKKSVKLVVQLKEKRKPMETFQQTSPSVPGNTVNKAADNAPIIRRGPGEFPGSQVVEEPVKSRIETVTDKPLLLNDGVVLKHQTITVTYVKPIKEVAIVNGQQKVLAESEEIVSREVDESFIELPQGVEDSFGKNLESITSVEKPDDVLVDGVLVKRKISRTKVSKIDPKKSPSDNEIMKHVEDGTLDEIIPVVSPKVEARAPSAGETRLKKSDEGTRKQPNILEYHRCLDDGTVLRRLVAPSLQQPVGERQLDPFAVGSDSSPNAPTQPALDEYVLALPSGVIEPNTENRDTAMRVKDGVKMGDDGKPVMVSIATVVVSPKKGYPDKKTVEGDVQSRVKWSDGKFNTSDGVNVVKKVKTTEYFKPMQEITTVDGVETSKESYEVPLRNETIENVLELHPGCVEPFGSNVTTTVSVGPWQDSIEKNIPTRTKAVKLTVMLKDKSSALAIVASPVIVDPTVKKLIDKRNPAKEILEGPIELRTETVEDKPLLLADGGTLLHKTVTATRVKMIKDVAFLDGHAKVLATREEIVDKEIDECFVELPRGVKQQLGKRLQSVTSTEKVDDSMIDGVLVKKTITRTIVSRTQRDSPSDNEIRQHVSDGTLDEIIPVSIAKVELASPSAGDNSPIMEDEVNNEPILVEYQRCLDDGTVLRRLMAIEKQPVPVEKSNCEDPDGENAVVEPALEVVVYDNVLALAPCSIEPNGDGHHASINVQNFNKPMIDNTPTKVVAVTAVVSPEGEDIMARKTVEGDVQSRTSWSEDVTVTDDGTKITRNIKTTEFYKPVKEVACAFGIESTLESREEPVLFKTTENILEIHPGCVEAFGSNVSTDIRITRSNDLLPNGVPMTTKVVTVSVRLDDDKSPQTSNPVAAKTLSSSTVAKTPIDQKATTRIVEELLEPRREVIDDKPRGLSSGGTVNHQTVNVTHSKLVKEIAMTNDGPQLLSSREVVVSREANEVFVELPRGVMSQFGSNLESITKIDLLDDVIVSGVPVKRKITRTKVLRTNPSMVPDGDILRHIQEGTPDEVIPLNAPKMESEPFIRTVTSAVVNGSPSVEKRKEGDGLSKPDVLEYHRCLEDGTVIHRLAAATLREIPSEQIDAVKPKEGNTDKQKPQIEKDVDDCILALPPGVIEPSNEKCDTSITVQNQDKTDSGGLPVNVSVTTAVISRTVDGDQITRKAEEGELQSRTTWSEDAFVTDDGINIVRKTKTTHFFRPVSDSPLTKGIKTELGVVQEESVKYDVVENILQLHPGCVEPFGSNVRTKVTVNKLDGTHESGVPLKKKTVKLVVTLDATDTELKPSNDSSKKLKPISPATAVRPDSARKGNNVPNADKKSGTGIQIVEDPTESRTVVKEDEQPLTSGGTIKHRTIVTVRVKPIKEVVVINGQMQVLSSREETVDKEIDETFTELPPGITAEYGENVESVTSVERLNDTVIDGVLVKKTVTRKLVKKFDPELFSDDEIRRHLTNATLGDILPIEAPELDCGRGTLVDRKGQPDVLEHHRCLDDGTVVRRVVAVTKCAVSDSPEGVPGSTTPEVPSCTHNEVEIDENVLVLPTGVIRPEHDNCDASVAVKNFVKPDEDGTLVKTTVATAVVAPKDATKKTVEGELQSRTTWSESKSNSADGGSVLTKTKSVEFFKPVIEMSLIDGKEISSSTRDITVRFEITENVVELHPGCVEPFGSNVSTDVTVNKVDDHSVNGYPATKKSVKLVVQLKEKRKPMETFQQTSPSVPGNTVNKAADNAPIIRRGPGEFPGSQVVEEPVKSRIETVTDKPLLMNDGVVLKHQTITVTYVKPIKEVAIVNGQQKVLAESEEIVSREVDESFIELPQGVEDSFGKNLESITSVEKPDDVLVDGVLVKRKISRTKVSKIDPKKSPSDNEIMKHVEDGTLDEIIPVVSPKVEARASSAGATRLKKSDEGTRKQPNILEYHRCLDDGTVLRRLVAPSLQQPVGERQLDPFAVGSDSSPNAPTQPALDEYVLALPSGVIEPNTENRDTAMRVKDGVKMGDDGKPVMVSIATVVVSPKKGYPDKKTVEGDVQSRVKWSDGKFNTSDGVNVVKKVKTTEYFKPMQEITTVDGVETSKESYEVPLRNETIENVLELHPGCVEPFGSNVTTTVSVGPWQDSIEKNIPTRTKAVKLTVMLKDKSSALAIVASPVIVDPTVKKLIDKRNPAKEILDGPIELRTETVEDKPLLLADGGTLLHKTVTATRVKMIKDVAFLDGHAKVLATREEIVDKEIDECFVELPRGVKQQLGKRLQSVTSTEKVDDSMIDGVLVKKTITRTIVSRTQRDSPSDNEIRQHVSDGTLDEIIPVSIAKVELASPSAGDNSPIMEDEVNNEPILVEYQRCLDDGTVLRRLMAIEKQPVPVEKSNCEDPDGENAVVEPALEVVVYDNVLALAPCSIEPNGDGHHASINVQNFNKPMIDNTPTKVVAVTAVVSPEGEDIMARKTVEGDVQSRTSWSEDVTVTDDGTKITRNIKTTEFYKPVKEVACAFGIESTLESREEPVLFKTTENILEIHPGCVEAFGSNVSTDIRITRSNDLLPNGVPMTTKVVTVSVRLDDDKSPQTSNPVAAKTLSSSTVAKTPIDQKATTRIVEELLEPRREVIDDKPRGLSSGGTVNHQTVNVTHSKLVKEIAMTNDGPQLLSSREVVVSREANEVFVELPRGVMSQFGSNLESITKIDLLDDVIVSGVPVKRKITRTKVLRTNPSMVPDGDILRHIQEGTPDEVIPLNAPKMESEPFIRTVTSAVVNGSPSVEKRKEGDGLSKPDVLEYHRCLEDGTVIHRLAAATLREIPSEQIDAVKPKEGNTDKQKPQIEKDVDDCILALPPGVIEPSNEKCDTSITVQNQDKTDSGGLPVNVSVTTAVISRTVDGDQITRKAEEGELQSRTTWSEDAFVTDDGINIVRKTKTTHFFRPVSDSPLTKGIKTELGVVQEESVKYDVVENILQLHPGCVEPFGSNVRTKVTVNKLDGTHESGVPLKKKTVKLVVTLDATDTELKPSNDSSKKLKPISPATAVRPDSARKGNNVPNADKKSGTGIQIVEDPTESRTVVKEDEQPLTSGGTIKHRTVVTVRVKPIKEVVVINGQMQVLSSREETVDKEIDETFTELPPGITAEYGENVESVTSVERLNDTVIDGVLVKKTVTRKLVKKFDPELFSDDEIRRHLTNATLGDILPIEAPELDCGRGTLVDRKGQPDVLEHHRCLDDGTVVRRVVAVTKCAVSDSPEGVPGSTTPEVPSCTHNEVEIDENVLVLPTGVIRPEHDNCDASVAVKNFVKPDEDGTLVKTTVATAVVAPKDATKKTVEGELQSRTTWSESKSNSADGGSVLTKTKSVEFFKPVIEMSLIDGKEISSSTRDITVRFEITENVVELHPGCVEPFGRNVSTDMSINDSDDVLPSGIPVKRKMVKLTVRLISETEKPPTEQHELPQFSDRQKKDATVPVSRRPGSGRRPETEIIEEPVESRVVVKEDEQPLAGGATLKHRTVTVTRVKPIKEVSVVQGHQQVISSREEIVDKEIDEYFVELPAGVTDQFGKNLESVSGVERPDDVVVDGVLVKRKITKTKVNVVGVDSPSDEEILQHIRDGTLDDIVPLALPKAELKPSASKGGAPKADVNTPQPNIVEYHRCLEDGTVVRRVVTSKACPIPTDGDNNKDSDGEVLEPPIEIQVNESVLALPPGIIKPQLDNVDASVAVRDFEKPNGDGVVVKTAITSTVVAPKRVPDGRRTIEGPTETRRQVEEDRRSLDDGSTIKTKIITTRHVRSVTELVIIDGVETVSDVREETVGVDVEEHILELPAGVIEPSAANCDTDITVHQSDDHRLADGTPAKLKVVRMIVKLKDQPVKSPLVQSIEGVVVPRVDIRETERTLPDGTVVRTRVTTTRQIRPITEVTAVDGVPTVTGYREQVVGATVDEDVMRLGPGVAEPVENDPAVHVTRAEPTTRQTSLPDGTPTATTTTTTSYFKDPVEEKKPPSVTRKFVEGAIESKTSVDDNCTTRPDGATVHRRTATTRLVKPIRVVTLTDGEETDIVLREELVGTEVEERVVELPAGVVDVNDRSIRTTRTEQNFDETMHDGTPLRRKLINIVGRKSALEVTTTITKKKLVTRKIRRIGPDGELIEDLITVEEDDDGGSVGSATSSRRSSVSDPAGGLLSPNEDDGPLSPSSSELDLVGAVGVFADVIELEPSINTDVQEFDDAILPDSTAVRKRIVTTTERRTIVMRALLPTDKDGETDTAAAQELLDGERSRRAGSPVVRYTDLSKSEPETVSDLCERTETLPNGQLVKRRVRTTGQRQVTTERTLLTGRLDDDNFRSFGVLDRAPMTPTSETILSPGSTQRQFCYHTSSLPPSGDEQTSRLVLRRHIHKKTILQGDKEQTLITETTHVEQDSDPPPDLSASIQEVIEQFMSNRDQYAGTAAIEASSETAADEAGTTSESGATVEQ